MQASNSNADNRPQVGDANNDIASYANTNSIGKFSGEPVGNMNLGREIDGETNSGLVLSRPYTQVSDERTEEALNTRFHSINTEDHHERGHNTIGGVLGDVISMNSDQFSKPDSASERSTNTSRANISVGQSLRGHDGQHDRNEHDNDTDLNASRTTLDTTTNERPFVTTNNIENRSGTGVNVGGNDENRRTGNWDNDISSQLVGGPRPGTKVGGPEGTKDVPYDVTNQMYYAESTGNVKPTEKFGISKDGGQAPLEGYDVGNEAAMKGVTTETEEYAHQFAPKEPINTNNAGTTWAT